MAIYKLGDISKIISGAKTDGSHGDIPVVGSGGIFGYTSKSRYNGSSILLPRIGTMKILWFPNAVWNANTAFLIGDLDIDIVIKKYLLYLLLTNNKWKSFISGSTIPKIRITDWRNLLLDIPTIQRQKKIIDIIEPHEKLFLSYSNCVRIDTIDDAAHDINQLIDIIEPLEQYEIKLKKLILIVENIIKKLPYKKTIKFNSIAKMIRNKPKNIKQISAKVLNKRTTFINVLENENTYVTNTFFTPRKTLVINTIRTYLEKFGIVPMDVDSNGTLVQISVDKNYETSVLSTLLNDEFWSRAAQYSQGTKMPVIKKIDIMNSPIRVTLDVDGLFETISLINNTIFKVNSLKNKAINLLIK